MTFIDHNVFIDGDQLMWRAAYSKGAENVCAYILRYFFEIMSRLNSPNVAVIWDSGKSRWRTHFFPKYKSHRSDRKTEFDKELMFQEKERAKTTLEYFGVRSVSVPGVEADDLISILVTYSTLCNRKSVVVSRDSDLTQLINDTVTLYDPYSEKFTSKGDLEVCAELVPEMKALAGDASDNIPGIKDIGKVHAVKMLSGGGVHRAVNGGDVSAISSNKKKVVSLLSSLEDFYLYYRLCVLPNVMDAKFFFSPFEKIELKKELNRSVPIDSLRASVEFTSVNTFGVYRFMMFSPDFIGTGLFQFLDADYYGGMQNYSSLTHSVGNCRNCTLYSGSKSELSSKFYPKLAIVLESQSEDQTEVDNLIKSLKVSKSDCVVLHLIKCGSDKIPKLWNAFGCSYFLFSELSIYKPKFVIAIGSLPSVVLSGKVDKPSDITGYVTGDGKVGVLPDFRLNRFSDKNKADYDYGVNKIKDFLDKNNIRD